MAESIDTRVIIANFLELQKRQQKTNELLEQVVKLLQEMRDRQKTG